MLEGWSEAFAHGPRRQGRRQVRRQQPEPPGRCSHEPIASLPPQKNSAGKPGLWGAPYHNGALWSSPKRELYASPIASKVSRWWIADSSEKQQNTTRTMPRGAAATSDATVPTATRAARSAGKR